MRNPILRHLCFASTLALTTVLVGCRDAMKPVAPVTTTAPVKTATVPVQDDVADERAKLSPDDRTLVDAQEWCVVMTDERLGSMGAPIKVMLKEQPVFVCCKGCKKKAEADPDKTLATLEELKAKKKQQSAGTK